MTVQDASQDELPLVCAGIARARDALQQCGIAAPASLRVSIVDGLIKECGVHAFGVFDSVKSEIRIASFRACISTVLEGSAYRRLPSQEFFTSIVAHETVHAIFDSALAGRKIGNAASEYVAYAIQLSTMPIESRAGFLAGFKRYTPEDLQVFHDIVLYLAPESFAVLAYDHFRQPDKGCRVVRGILDGKIRFPSVEDMR